jgi:hypothetical protein
MIVATFNVENRTHHHRRSHQGTTARAKIDYKRAARTAAELQLGDFVHLHEAIPELQELGSTPPSMGSSA